MSATWNQKVITSLMAYKKSVDEGAAKAHGRGQRLMFASAASTSSNEPRVREYMHRATVLTHIGIAIAEYVTRKAKANDQKT